MDKKPNAIAVTGIAGSGKGFLIQEATEGMDNVSVFSTNRLLKELTDADGIDIRLLTNESSIDRQTDLLAERLNDRLNGDSGRIGILDTHLTHHRAGSIITDNRIVSKVYPSDLLLIESDPEEILHRRIIDQPQRNRVIEPLEAIRYHQEQEKIAAIKTGKELEIPTLFLDNTPENTVRNINYLKSIVSNLVPNKIILESGERFLHDKDAGSIIFNNPNAIIPYGELPDFDIDENLKESILGSIDDIQSESDYAFKIYRLMCERFRYDEQCYLNFNNLGKSTDLYKQHMGQIGTKYSTPDIVCNDFSLLLAKLIQVATGKKGFIENDLATGISGVIPHTNYMIELKDNVGVPRNFVFDSMWSFSNSDLLRAKLNIEIDPGMTREEVQIFDTEIYRSLILPCEGTDGLAQVISYFMALPVVERSSFIKNVLKEYSSCFHVSTAFNRYRFDGNQRQHLACIFNVKESDRIRNFIVIDDIFKEISDEFQSKLESNGVLRCISRTQRSL